MNVIRYGPEYASNEKGMISQTWVIEVRSTNGGPDLEPRLPSFSRQ